MRVDSFLLIATLLQQSHAFLSTESPATSSVATKISAVMPDLTFETPDMTTVQEPACIDTANAYKLISVPVSSEVSAQGSVGISYVHWPAEKPKANSPPLILVHGLDSSALEFRRLGSKLATKGIDTYAVDLLGWGFTQLDDVESFSAKAKVEALGSFVETMFGKDAKFCLVGASIGGASAITLAAEKQSNLAGLVLIDAQGFIDGIGPMAIMPRPIAKLGVELLRSYSLRNSASQMSYYDKENFATDDAVVISQLHCLREGWDNAMINFMQSGGFTPSKLVSQIESPTLVLWGRQDGILDGKEFANKVRFGIISQIGKFLFYFLLHHDLISLPLNGIVCRDSTKWSIAVA
jgi:pimeloyl-ACP methyl ester carboxylesterase